MGGELATLLRSHNINMKFGVHPVAGRMPGQMNVLLAEANVPHDWVFEMEEVNQNMENNDVALIVGANDVVNSAALEIEGCAIWGMPVMRFGSPRRSSSASVVWEGVMLTWTIQCSTRTTLTCSWEMRRRRPISSCSRSANSCPQCEANQALVACRRLVGLAYNCAPLS